MIDCIKAEAPKNCNKRSRMLIVFGSIVALVASFLTYTKSRRYWNTMALKLLLELKFNLLGMRETALDIVNSRYNKTDLPDKRGHVAIVTGGSRGIGVAVVKMLLQCNAEVIIACRNKESGEKAIQQIREGGILKGQAKVYTLDNASLKSVKQFANDIKRNYEKIHILINNAGIMFTPYSETEEGFEMQWGVNYLSHFLLTAQLMPLLCNAGTSQHSTRIINVSSCAQLLGTINFTDINYNKRQPFLTNAAYGQSKLAQLMFTRILQKICDEKHLPIKAYAVHPGIVNTDLFQNSFLNKANWIMNLFFKTPEQGAITTIYAAVSDKIENKGGLYLSNCREAVVNPLTNDVAIQEKLFKLSLEQTELITFM